MKTPIRDDNIGQCNGCFLQSTDLEDSREFPSPSSVSQLDQYPQREQTSVVSAVSVNRRIRRKMNHWKIKGIYRRMKETIHELDLSVQRFIESWITVFELKVCRRKSLKQDTWQRLRMGRQRTDSFRWKSSNSSDRESNLAIKLSLTSFSSSRDLAMTANWLCSSETLFWAFAWLKNEGKRLSEETPTFSSSRIWILSS